MPDPTILTSEPFGTYFWFRDLGGTLVERPLREMTAVEVLWAWRWQCERARRQHRPGQKWFFWSLLLAAMPDWPEGMSVGNAVHQFWPGGRPMN